VIASTIPPLASHAETIGGIEYQVYDYAGLTWMVEDVKHGTPTYTTYGSDITKTGYWFIYDARIGICTGDYRFPTKDDGLALVGALNDPFMTSSELFPWQSSNMMKGYVLATGTGGNWGTAAYYMLEEPKGYVMINAATAIQADYPETAQQPGTGMPIRCVRDTD
jgi:hypothetical protein